MRFRDVSSVGTRLPAGVLGRTNTSEHTAGVSVRLIVGGSLFNIYFNDLDDGAEYTLTKHRTI